MNEVVTSVDTGIPPYARARSVAGLTSGSPCHCRAPSSPRFTGGGNRVLGGSRQVTMRLRLVMRFSLAGASRNRAQAAVNAVKTMALGTEGGDAY